MLPTEDLNAKFMGRVGAELDVEAARKAAHLAALNALAVARQHLGSLDKVTRIVRLGVAVATSGDVRDQPKVADAASELLQDIFGKDKNPCRLVYGVASLPLGTPVDWKSFLRLPGNSPGEAEVNDAAFCLVSLDPMLARPLRSISGFTDAGITSIAGPSSRRQPSHGTPGFLSHGRDRRALHLL